MVERHVFIRLKSEHATERGLQDVLMRSRGLQGLPGVVSLTTGTPADADARGAWDLSLTLHFVALSDVERCLQHPTYVAYQKDFLEVRAQVIKAWNFEV